MRPRQRRLLSSVSISHVALVIASIDICQRFVFHPIPNSYSNTNALRMTHVENVDDNHHHHHSEISQRIDATTTLHSEPSLPVVATLPDHITSVFINIGSNLDPILPPADFGDDAITIAFEPIVGCDILGTNLPSKSIHNIHHHHQLLVVHAAVSATSGLTSMYMYNKNGESSSLSKATAKSYWNSNTNNRTSDGTIRMVPLLTLPQILHAIPTHIHIPYIKTDMQGHDFAAIAAAGPMLFERGVDYIMTEVFFHDETSYEGVQNDFCHDWWPHMQRVGYDLVYFKKFEFVPQANDTSAALKLCGAQDRRRRHQHHRDKDKNNNNNRPSSSKNSFFLSEGDALWKRRGAADRVFHFRSLKDIPTDS